MTKRKYKCRVPVLLVSAATAAQNMEMNLDAFEKDYPEWTEERISSFNAEIEDVSTKIGVKGNKAQHEATVLLHKKTNCVIDDAITVRSQMERGYRKEPQRLKDLLILLGFTKNWRQASNGNHTAMLDLIHTFNNNTDDALIDELTAHGVITYRILSMKDAAGELTAANINQETMKSEAPLITDEMNIRLNEIYDTAMDICAAGKTVFRKDPVRKALFNFTKLIALQTSISKAKTDKPTDKPTDPPTSVETPPTPPETLTDPSEITK